MVNNNIYNFFHNMILQYNLMTSSKNKNVHHFINVKHNLLLYNAKTMLKKPRTLHNNKA